MEDGMSVLKIIDFWFCDDDSASYKEFINIRQDYFKILT
jgi:hypothetical protein